MYTNRIAWEPLRKLDASTLTTSYQVVQGPSLQAGYIVKMANTSSSIVLISIDGVNDIDILPGGSFWLYDEYKGIDREGLPQGTRFFVKLETGSVASAGFIYLVSQYLVTI
jgi:hypothetical protein